MSKQAVVCITGNEMQTISIVNQLRAEGFAADDISILYPDSLGNADLGYEKHTKAPEKER